jgi:hypothetical protein
LYLELTTIMIKTVFICYVIVYFIGVCISAFRITFIHSKFHKYLREKHPHRLKEFWLISGSVFNPSRAFIALYKRHDIKDPELAILLTKTRNSCTFCYLWCFVGFFGLCFVPLLFGVFEIFFKSL